MLNYIYREKIDKLEIENELLKRKLEAAIKALQDINAAELRSQRPGGGYTISATLSFNALQDLTCEK